MKTNRANSAGVVDAPRGGWLGEWRVAVAVIAFASYGAIAVSSSTAAGVANAPARTLGECASAWTNAPLGDGRREIPGGPRGLIVRFTDGVCGLAVSAQQAAISDSDPVLVQVLSGDYAWGFDDPSGYTPRPAQIAAIERRSANYSNVRIDIHTGRVTPNPGARIVALPFPEATKAAKDKPCPTILSAPSYYQPPPLYTVTKTTVNCALTREIVWAYNDHEGKLLTPASPGDRLIIGWHCHGAPVPGQPQNAPPTSGQITCTNRSQQIEVQADWPRLNL